MPARDCYELTVTLALPPCPSGASTAAHSPSRRPRVGFESVTPTNQGVADNHEQASTIIQGADPAMGIGDGGQHSVSGAERWSYCQCLDAVVPTHLT